jgi:hypothetical protein
MTRPDAVPAIAYCATILCNEGGGPPVLAKLPHGALGQKARSEGIDATADAEHIGRLPAVDEIGLEKRDALFDFMRGVEIGLNSKRLDDR